VFLFWLLYFVMASVVYIVCCAVLVYWMSIRLTEPIITLTGKIKMNVTNVQQQKYNKRGNFDFQVDFMTGYKDRNQEMNQLYISFNEIAKILALSEQTL